MGKRLIVYLAFCYFLASIGLFAIYYFASKTYFYRVQKDLIVKKKYESEKLFLGTLLNDLSSAKDMLGSKKESYRELLEKLGKEKLSGLIRALETHGGPRNPATADTGEPDELNGPGISMSGDKKPAENVTHPRRGDGGREEMLAIVDSFSGEPGDMIMIRLFLDGSLRKPRPLEYMEIAQAVFSFKNLSASPETWTLRAYGRPFSEDGSDLIGQVIQRYRKTRPEEMERLAVFRFDAKEPLFRGENNDIDAEKIALYEKKALTFQRTYFDSEQSVTSSPNMVEEIAIVNHVSDPQMAVTMSLCGRISEVEWTQFSFYDRNKEVIISFAVLAWFIFPISALVAYRMAVKMRFSMTTNLEGDEDRAEAFAGSGFQSPGAGEAGTTSAQTAAAKAGEEEAAAKPAAPSASAQARTQAPAAQARQQSQAASSSAQLQAVTAARPGSQKPEGLQRVFDESSKSKESVDIRLNNIRKSTGGFNRREDENEVDYLGGVQSEVLKSLIQKLRKG